MQGTTGLRQDNFLLVEKSKEELISQALEATALKRKLKKRWKKLGRPVGHPGITRHKPEFIHRTVHQTLEARHLD